MSFEEDVTALLNPLVAGQVFWDFTPDNYDYPFILLYQRGGRGYWYVDKTIPSHKNAKLDIEVWAKTKEAAARIIREVESAFAGSTMVVTPLGAFGSMSDPVQKLHGSQQDFSVWYPDPPITP